MPANDRERIRACGARAVPNVFRKCDGSAWGPDRLKAARARPDAEVMRRLGRALRANRRAVATTVAALAVALVFAELREAAVGAVVAVVLVAAPVRRRRPVQDVERSTESELRTL